jgi:hypothetical protein
VSKEVRKLAKVIREAERLEAADKQRAVPLKPGEVMP